MSECREIVLMAKAKYDHLKQIEQEYDINAPNEQKRMSSTSVDVKDNVQSKKQNQVEQTDQTGEGLKPISHQQTVKLSLKKRKTTGRNNNRYKMITTSPEVFYQDINEQKSKKKSTRSFTRPPKGKLLSSDNVLKRKWLKFQM